MPATYVTILNSEVDPDSPITTSLSTRYRDNPVAIAEGAPHPNPGGGEFCPRVAVEKDPNFSPLVPTPGSPAKQTALVTDQIDPTLVMVPDGLGSVVFVPVTQALGPGTFHVEGQWTGPTGVSVNTNLILPTEVADPNGNYDQPTGVFTAPKAGKFQFDFFGVAARTSTNGTWDTILQRDQGSATWVNARFLHPQHPGGGGAPFAVVAVRAVLALLAGEQVRTRVVTSNASGGGQDTYGTTLPIASNISHGPGDNVFTWTGKFLSA